MASAAGMTGHIEGIPEVEARRIASIVLEAFRGAAERGKTVADALEEAEARLARLGSIVVRWGGRTVRLKPCPYCPPPWGGVTDNTLIATYVGPGGSVWSLEMLVEGRVEPGDSAEALLRQPFTLMICNADECYEFYTYNPWR